MTTNQKIDALSDSIDKLSHKMDKRFDEIDERLDEHDQQFVDLGALHVELSHKLDTVIRQTSDLPEIRDDISYLKRKVAPIDYNFKKIDEQFIRMEAKNDYMLEQLKKLVAREYA